MSISAPRIRLIPPALDAVPEEDITLALSTRKLKSSYTGPCVQVRRDMPENSLVFLSRVDGPDNDRFDGIAVSTGNVYAVGRQRAATFYNAQGSSALVGADYGVYSYQPMPFIVKYANGTPLWVASIDAYTQFALDIYLANEVGSQSQRIGIGADIDGNVFVSTNIYGSTVTVYDSGGVASPLPWGTNTYYGTPVTKFTANGNVAWAASVRSEVYVVQTRGGIVSDQASGAYVCGSYSGGNADTVSNVILYDSAGMAGPTIPATGVQTRAPWLGRYNATGSPLWAATIQASECCISSVVPDGNGGVLACGDISVASGTTANVLHANGSVFATFTARNRSALMVKYDAAGTVLAAFRATTYTVASFSTRVASDGTGNVYLSGQYNGRNIYHSNNALAGQLVTPTGYHAAFLVKYNSSLNPVWWTSVDGSLSTPSGVSFRGATSLAADANGVYMTGFYDSIFVSGGTANVYHANTAVAGVLPSVANGGGFCVSYSPTGNVTSWSSTSSGSIEGVALDPLRNRAMVVGYSASGTTANILNQSGTVLSSITGTGEAGFLGAFQLGSTTKDIGFKRGSIDTDALKTHCPVSSNGYVQTWYSQTPAIETPLIEEYPPAPMTADTTTLSGQAYGNGTYVAKVSSMYQSNYGWRAFDRGLTAVASVNTWLSAQYTYTDGTAVNTTAIVDGVGVAGEWVQLKLPLPIILSGYGIMPQTNYLTSRNPFDFTIAGSYDGVTWTRIDTRVSQTGYVAEELKQFSVVPIPTVAYQYYRLIISKTPAVSGATLVCVGEWRLYSNYSDRNARQFVTQNQPLLVENGIVKTNSTNRPLIDFSGGKSLVVGNDVTAAGTPIYTANTSGLGQSTYTSTITSGEVIGTRIATPTLIENQQFAYGSTPNTLSSARATIGSTPVLDTLSQHAQTSCLAAFSFRKLFLEYKGPVVRLRRESDNVERDFYGSPSAIELWIGSSSARVVTLYDQSSSNKNATQITSENQPLVTKQFGVYVANFSGTSLVPQFMTFGDIYPASFWSQYYINQLNQSTSATLFARAGADYGFRKLTMTGNTDDFLGSNIDIKPYWMINQQYGSNNQNPKSVSLQVWNRVTGSRMTPTLSTQQINQLGRGYTPLFRDFNGFLGELVFFSKPALVSDMLLLDASPLVKTTQTIVPGKIVVPRTNYYVQLRFSVASILEAGQYMADSVATPFIRTSSLPLIIDGQDLNGYQYVVKRGNFSVSPGYNPLDWFSDVKDTRSAWIVVDGNLTIENGCVFTPPVRKLFSVIYVKGNLVLDGEISMTARGANHNGTGDSAFLSVFPSKNISLYKGTYGDLFGATNAYVPAGGGSGGVPAVGTGFGNQGTNGITGESAGGGTGGKGGTSVARQGAGTAGTAFSGGTGGGGSTNDLQGTDGEPNGGKGGVNWYSIYTIPYGSEGGAGNGPNGTGGTLFVIVSGTVSGAGKVTSHGSVGVGGGGGGGFSISGGGSGGGSAWLLAGSGGDSIKVTATGGDRARVRSGLGGNGSAMKISLRNPSISTSTRSSVVGAYSLRRLFGGWGGPVVRVRHGTTNEQRDFYAEDLPVGAALDVFLAGAVAYIQIWYDQSGSNNHASQTTTTSQPWIVRDASWTTKPTVRCGGTGFLTYNGTGLVNTNYTVAVSTARTGTPNDNYFMGGTATGTNQNLIVGYRRSAQVNHGQFTNDLLMTIEGYVTPTPDTFVFRHSSTLGKNTYRNGTFLGSSASLAPLTAYVGAMIGRWSAAYTGDISEVVLLSSYMPDTERSILETSMIYYNT